MKEFLIRRKDKDFLLFSTDKFNEVLRPNTIKSEKIEGWGNHRILANGCEISFSFEEVGIQIGFENCEISDENAETIVNEICLNIENEIKSPCYSIQISD